MAETQFIKGMEVEVCSDDSGLRGAWFVATVLRSASKKNKVLVEYHTLMADEKGSKPLREFANAVNLRPIPPRERNRSFEISDEVNAFHNDGWWEGIVIRVLENSRYSVYFRSGKEELDFHQSELRIHREWVRGSWVPPMEEKEEVEVDQLNEEEEKKKEEATDTEHNQVDTRRTDQARSSLVHSAADVANEVSTRKQMTKRPIAEVNNTKISPPCKKFKKGELREVTLVKSENRGDLIPGTPATKGDEELMPTTKDEETPLQKKEEVINTLTDIFSSPSEVHLTPNIDEDKLGSGCDCDSSPESLPIITNFSFSPKFPLSAGSVCLDKRKSFTV